MVAGLSGQGLFYATGVSVTLVAVMSLVGGAMFMMWLGEQVTERGIGNGISMLIFAGIVAGLPSALGQAFESARQGDLNFLVLILIGLVAIAVVWGVVRMERAQRRIPIHYARRQQGRRQMQPQASYLPLKINMAGVIPAIFASSILLFPASIAQWAGQSSGSELLQDIALMLSPGQPLNILLFTLMIVFFCYFYTAITFNSKEVSENLKRSGGSIPGIRPGMKTADYLDSVLGRLTLVGAIYIAAVCLMPQFLVVFANIPFYLGGTSLLIVVVVVMDFMAQIQQHMMSTQYDGLMKKANLKNYGNGAR
jgi:preprotein translocase subunit SecY